MTVQEGCDKFCSFCVVPYTRGAEASRPVGQILDEIARLASAGVREVTLIGQNVNAYHGLDGDGRAVGLAALIRAVAAVPGIARVRYTTSHPNDMSEELIDAHRDIPELAPYLHLPVQSGSDRILKSMNRRHRAADYLDIVARVRAARPDIALSSDFIVGYPGETDADFEATLALVRAVGFASAYAFKYSPRPGTPAAEMAGQVDEAIEGARASLSFRRSSRSSGRPSTARPSDGASRFCSRSPAATRARSSAGRPICSRCSPRGRARSSARWRRSKSSPPSPIRCARRIVAPAS